MKKFIVAASALLVFALSASTYAAADAVLGTPLIEKKTSGGFVPPEYAGWGENISIYANGKVFLSHRANGNSLWQHQLLATLAPEVLQKIATAIQTITPGELVFPDEPECTDAPVTTYSAKNSAGAMVTFAQIRACLIGVLESFDDAYRLQRVLDGLHALSIN